MTQRWRKLGVIFPQRDADVWNQRPSAPCVFRTEDRYLMYLHGLQFFSEQRKLTRIGLAEAPLDDPLDWRMVSQEPLIDLGGEGATDSHMAAYPWVVRITFHFYVDNPPGFHYILWVWATGHFPCRTRQGCACGVDRQCHGRQAQLLPRSGNQSLPVDLADVREKRVRWRWWQLYDRQRRLSNEWSREIHSQLPIRTRTRIGGRKHHEEAHRARQRLFCDGYCHRCPLAIASCHWAYSPRAEICSENRTLWGSYGLYCHGIYGGP